jgi:hypothetical protein
VLSAAAALAHGQAPGTDSPLERTRADELLEAPDGSAGFSAGGFELRAAAGMSFAYDSNVFAEDTPRTESPLAVGEILLRADNDALRRRLGLDAFVRTRQYEDHGELDATEFGAAGTFDWQPESRNSLRLSADAQRRVEPRTDIETPTDIPVSLYDDLSLQAAGEHTFNRLALRLTLDARRESYLEDSQAFRDLDQLDVQLRAAWQLRGNLAWTLTGYYDRDDFDTPSPSTESARTRGALLGVDYTKPDILELEFAAGYFARHFEAGSQPVDGLALRGTLAWYPTRLTHLRVELQRTDEPTQIPGAFSKVRSYLSVELGHEYARNLGLFAGARVVVDDFESLSRTDRLYQGELGVSYAAGRHALLRAGWRYAARAESTPERDFVRHLFNVSFVGRL